MSASLSPVPIAATGASFRVTGLAVLGPVAEDDGVEGSGAATDVFASGSDSGFSSLASSSRTFDLSTNSWYVALTFRRCSITGAGLRCKR
jgi:hypothetical protein